jgi:hypothetical protein
MKRFAIAAALALAIGLSAASTADAQYVIQYNRVTPNGGIATTRQLYNLGTMQQYNSYVSPWGTVRQQAYYTDVFGNSFGRAQGFSPYFGAYDRGFYQPNPFAFPYNPGYNYNFYRRW